MSEHPRAVDFDEVWGKLEAACEAVIRLESVGSLSSMQLYRAVYSLAGAHPRSFAEDMYEKLVAFFTRAARRVAARLADMSAETVVGAYVAEWETYELGSRVVSNIFNYLNDHWITRRAEDARGVLREMYKVRDGGGDGGGGGGAAAAAGGGGGDGGGPEEKEKKGGRTAVYRVDKLALVMWREEVFGPLKSRLVYSLLEMVRRERDGETIERRVVRETVASFVKLGLEKNAPLEVYRATIEVPYIHALSEYYASESAGFLAQNATRDYLELAERRLVAEEERAGAFLDAASGVKVRAAASDALVRAHLAALEAEAIPLVAAAAADEAAMAALVRLVALLGAVKGAYGPVAEALATYIEDEGRSAVAKLGEAGAQEPKAFVDTLLGHHAHFKAVVERGFGGRPVFAAALDKGMRGVVNAKGGSGSGGAASTTSAAGRLPPAPELLALYCDMVLRKGGKVEGAELESIFDSVLAVFQYLEDKDVFQKFYAKMLAKRLISGLSVSDDAEASMLTRLKTAAGYEYTSKIARMYTDVQVSAELDEKFAAYVDERSIDLGGVSFAVKVLTKGSWPLQLAPSAFVQPPELAKLIKHFESFYSAAHASRELHWMPHLSKGVVRTAHTARPYELIVTNFQMAILCLFNQGDEFSIAEITQLVGLDTKTVLRNVASLVRVKLLLIVDGGATDGASAGEAGGSGAEAGAGGGGGGGDDNDNDDGKKKKKKKKRAPIKLTGETRVGVNADFSNKRHRIKVTAALKESASERSTTIRAVDEDRKFYIQAAIVRVAKARKTIKHPLLVAEVCRMAQARFNPKVSLVKKCIEQLIDKGYLERGDEKGVYNYLA